MAYSGIFQYRLTLTLSTTISESRIPTRFSLRSSPSLGSTTHMHLSLPWPPTKPLSTAARCTAMLMAQNLTPVLTLQSPGGHPCHSPHPNHGQLLQIQPQNLILSFSLISDLHSQLGTEGSLDQTSVHFPSRMASLSASNQFCLSSLAVLLKKSIFLPFPHALPSAWNAIAQAHRSKSHPSFKAFAKGHFIRLW